MPWVDLNHGVDSFVDFVDCLSRLKKIITTRFIIGVEKDAMRATGGRALAATFDAANLPPTCYESDPGNKNSNLSTARCDNNNNPQIKKVKK